MGECEQSMGDRGLLHPLHSHKSPLRSCLVRCQPADHSPPDLQARLSMCECLHPLLEYPESPPFQGLPGRKHAKVPRKGISKMQTFSFFHTARYIQGSCLSRVHCPVRSRRWRTTPTPSSSYFVQTRYFSKIKALRRVYNNTLVKQEGLLEQGRRAEERTREEGQSISGAGKPCLPEQSHSGGRSLQPEFSKEEK